MELELELKSELEWHMESELELKSELHGKKQGSPSGMPDGVGYPDIFGQSGGTLIQICDAPSLERDKCAAVPDLTENFIVGGLSPVSRVAFANKTHLSERIKWDTT